MYSANRGSVLLVFESLLSCTGRRPKPIVGGGKATATPPFSRPHPFISRNAAGQDPALVFLGAWAGGGSFGMRLQRERAFGRVFPGASPSGSAPVYYGQRLPAF